MHGAGCQFGQARMARGRAVAAGMRRQQAQRPQFVRVATVLCLGAGLADQPGPCRLADLGRPSGAWQIVNRIERSDRAHPAGTPRDPLAVDSQHCRDLAGIAMFRHLQNDGRAFDMVRRSGARAGEVVQGGAVVVGETERHRGGFARHATPCRIAIKAGWMTQGSKSRQQGSKYVSLSIR